ncbi:hypothetical protein A2W24_01705 [Microgenomates group bacterium RBG_16_45_19]|nr:MAG: hypothetical protein A2W24_01705 [Microgenomates group bacterium RBG_16_45_19]
MKILIVCGSPRKNSLTRILTNLAFEYAKSTYPESDVRHLDLGLTPIEPFRGFEEKYNQVTLDAIQTVTGSEVFILGAPVYNGLVSSCLKNLFEHINYKALENKVAGFIVHSAGPISSLQVQGQLAAMMTYFRVFSNPRGVFTYRDQHFDKEKRILTDKGVEERVQRLVEETVGLAERFK